jgi:hypothetical protein
VSSEQSLACKLAEADARTQIDEWRELLQSTVATIERGSATSLALGLKDGTRLGALAELAQREVACCPFLEFSIHIDADRVTLHIAAPPGAAPILDGFASWAG